MVIVLSIGKAVLMRLQQRRTKLEMQIDAIHVTFWHRDYLYFAHVLCNLSNRLEQGQVILTGWRKGSKGISIP